MVVTIDIKDSVVDKILYFLESLKDDIKIIKKESDFILNMKKSEKDLEAKRVIEIDNIDEYISTLKNEIN